MRTKKKSKPAAKKTAAKKTPAKRAPAKKTPARKAVSEAKKAPAKKKTPSKPTLKPKPKATHPSKKDVGIFGTFQKNIKEGFSAIAETVAETVLPSPKRRKRG